MTDLSPIKDAFDKRDKTAEVKAAKAKLRDDIARLIREKGEAFAAKIARAEKMPDQTFRKLVNDWNAERAAEDEARAHAERQAGDGGGGGPPPPPPPGDEDKEPFFKKDPNYVRPLPEDCPVRPLGRSADKKVFYYLDGSQGLYAAEGKSSHNADALTALFGKDMWWAADRYAKFNERNGRHTGIKYDKLRDSLIAECDRKGVIDISTLVREEGGWRDRKGGLVLHCGDAVLIGGQWLPPGFHDGKLYPAKTARLKPCDAPADAAAADVLTAMIERLLTALDTWNWQNAGDADSLVGYGMDVDGSGHKLASLLWLGFHMAAKAAGALRHRPVIWISGESGTGKSTLLEFGKHLHGDAMIASTNATAAGVWTPLGLSCRPVGIDEAEPEAGNRRVQDLVRLAREAATEGGKILRGSSGHEGKAFEARCAFQFSSILIPSLLNQDISRICVLELGPLTGKGEPKVSEAELEAIGAAMLRRLIDNWSRWPDTFARFRDALAKTGHDPRGCNQYGTLLAMADMARFGAEGADNETITLLAAAVSAGAVSAASGKSTNAEDMLTHLWTKPLDVFRGGTRMTIGRMIEIATNNAGELPDGAPSSKQCKDALEAHGVFCEGAREKARIILPNKNEGLRQLFERSPWESQPGTTGVWPQAMKRLPGAQQENSRAIGGRGWSLPIKTFLQKEKGS